MRYDNDIYSGDDDDDDELWNDELDINTVDSYMETEGYSVTGGDHADHDDSDRFDKPILPDTYEEDDFERRDSYHEDYYSDDRQEPSLKKTERFSLAKGVDREEENDFYSSDEEPVKVKKSKAPKLDPEDPDYWIGEESELGDILSQTKDRWKWLLGGAVTLLLLILFAWIWFLRPYTDEAVKYGYVMSMERRGSIIKTFEGKMIPYKELSDPDPMYFEEVRFSVESDSLAARMKRMMIYCVPVRVEYKVYHTALPWKGEEKMIITKVDSVDVGKILPPEYRYYR